MERDTLTIRELAKKTGVSSKALRYWESRGLLPKPGRTHTGYRVYPASVVQKIQFIGKAKGIGFTLSEILSLFEIIMQRGIPCKAVDEWASRKLAALDRQIGLLTRLKTQLQWHRRRWRGRLPCPPMSPDEICCLIEELPLPATKLERR